MSHKKRFYHIILNTVPESLLATEGFNAKLNYGKNHSSKWIVLWSLVSSLSSDFDDYLELSPPTFMTKTIGLIHSEIRGIVGTVAENNLESEGWLKND